MSSSSSSTEGGNIEMNKHNDTDNDFADNQTKTTHQDHHADQESRTRCATDSTTDTAGSKGSSGGPRHVVALTAMLWVAAPFLLWQHPHHAQLFCLNKTHLRCPRHWWLWEIKTMIRGEAETTDNSNFKNYR